MKSPDFEWQDAAQAVMDGEAAMLLHGDWATGYSAQLGWRSGVDFGVVAAPGGDGVFVFGVDVFVHPRGAKNPEGALDFLKTVGSLEGQLAFSAVKGATPVRVDVEPDDLDGAGRDVLLSLESAQVVMDNEGLSRIDPLMRAFADDLDETALADAIMKEYFPGEAR